jgi:hypothetical protein
MILLIEKHLNSIIMKNIFTFLLFFYTVNIFSQTCPSISSAWDTHTNANTSLNPYAIATDELGNVFIAGYFNSTSSFNNGVPSISASTGSLFIVKYDKFGNTQWAKNAGANSQYDEILGITVKPDGSEIFVTGHFSSVVSFGTNSLTPTISNAAVYSQDIFVAKLIDTGGNRNWAWAVKAGGKGDDASVSIARDNAGSIYVGGTLDAYTPDGANNEAVVFGALATINCVQNKDSFVARLSDYGNIAMWDWVKTSTMNVACSVTNDFEDKLLALAVNKTNGDVFIAGHYYQSTGLISFGSTQFPTTYGYDAYFAKLDTDGNWQWATKAGGPCCPNFGYEYARGIAVDSIGNAFVIGDFSSIMSFGINSNEISSLTTTGISSVRDVFIGKINANGTWAWAKQMGGTSNDYGGGIKYQNGQIWGIGSFTGTATFKTSNQLISAGSEDIFLVNLDKNGNWLGDGATRAGGPGLEGSYPFQESRIAFDLDKNNVPVAAGRYNSPATFGSTILTKTNEDSFVFRANCGETTPTSTCNATMSAFNPCNVLNENFKVMAMTKDAAGYTYLAGKVVGAFGVDIAGFGGTQILPSDGTAIVIKYNSNNQAVYVVQGGGANAIINDISLINGNPVVAGDFSGTATFSKFNPFTNSSNTTVETVTSAGANDIFVAEIQTRTGPFSSMVTSWNWIKYAGGPVTDHVSAITTNGTNQVMITGYVGLTAMPTNFSPFSIPFTLGASNMYVAKINYNFNFLGGLLSVDWGYVSTPIQPNNPITASNELGIDIVANAAGEAFVIGHYAFSDFLNPTQAPAFGSTVLLPAKAIDVFVAKLNVNGTWAWATKAGNNTGFGSQSKAHSIALGDNNDVYIGASFILEPGDFQIFGNTTVSQIPALSNTQSFDALVGKINISGDWQWAKMISSSGNDIAGGVAFKNGKVHLTGYFEGTGNFGGTNITSAGLRDFYFARLTRLGQWLPAYSQRGGGVGQDLAYLKPGNNITYSLEIDADENDHTVGYHNSPATFGSTTLSPNATNLNAVVIKAFCSTCPATPLVLVSPGQNIPTANATQKTAANITASNLLTAGTVLYQAGTNILLNPGFSVSSGVVFKAQMGGCN